MYPTLESTVGNTPLVRLQRLPGATTNVVLGKLEGNNPAGSVKDRPALSMIVEAEKRGDIKPGDTLIEATSGNTGIALAMVAAMKGYRMVLVMPETPVARAPAVDARVRCRARADAEGGRHGDGARHRRGDARRRARASSSTSSPIPTIRSRTTAAPAPRSGATPTAAITHFVSAMGTTGTIMGVSRFLKEKNPAIRIIGAQPEEGSQIPGIRKWPEAYLPKIYDRARVDRIEYVSQADAEDMTRRLASEEGIFCGISAGGACAVALRISREVERRDDRVHRLRPRRPLPVDRRLPRLSARRPPPP